MTITGVKAWPRCVETWALEIILDSKGDWRLLADVKPELETSCEYAHIPKLYGSKKGQGTWNGAGFFSYPEGLWVSNPDETYWRNQMICDECQTVAHCMKNGCVPKQHDWKSEYQKAVDLHCITLDELREAEAWIKNLEKLMADQDVMLERQTARIVDLQTHIANLEGED